MKPPLHSEPFRGKAVSRQTCGFKDVAEYEKGLSGILDAALRVWAAKNNVDFGGWNKRAGRTEAKKGHKASFRQRER